MEFGGALRGGEGGKARERGLVLALEFRELCLRGGCGQAEHRRCVTADAGRVGAFAGLRQVVEERLEAVEVPLRKGVEFVVVAARAVEGLREPRGGDGLDAIGGGLGEKLFGDHAALLVEDVVSVEAGRDFLLERGVGQQVAGELLDGELIERFVVVKRPDHPVAPRVHLAVAVHLVSVGVGVARGVEPVGGHAFAVMGGRKKRRELGVQSGQTESSDGLWGWRQSGEVEAHAAEEGCGIGGWRGGEAFALEAGEDKAVDGIADPAFVFHGGWGNGAERLVGPVTLVARALGDPAAEGFLLLGGNSLVGLGGRHEFVVVHTREAEPRLRLIGAARHEGAKAFALSGGALVGVKAAMALTVGGVGAVALKAVVRENRADVAVKSQWLGGAERSDVEAGADGAD